MTGDSEPTETGEYGPFGHPLFSDPEARALSRVGVVDVGSNSVRLVVFDGAARSPAYFYNEKIMCGLGAGMSETGRLNPEGRRRALAALKRFQLLSDSIGFGPLSAVATAAVRDAEDGPVFCAEVEAATGIKLWVVDGREEARLSAQGVLLGWPGAYGLICDIGGSSMELAEIRDGHVGKRVTSNLGPLKLRDLKGGRKGRVAHIKETVSALAAEMGPQHDRLFLVGGSWRAIARIDMERRGYPLHVLHEYRMTRRAISATIKMIQKSDPEELRARCGISSSRMALVPYAAEVLTRLVQELGPRDIAVSSYGIREGLLYEQMPQKLRDRDPLLEAAHYAESKDARTPGFGTVLYQFLLPLFRNAPDTRKRLILTACLLHDIGWRAHPDFRPELGFFSATRANLGGIKHSERIFVGLAMLYRYRNNPDLSLFEPYLSLLDPASRKQAEVLGKAMRFGAMFGPGTAEGLGELRWQPKRRRLELRASGDAGPLFVEVVATRFNALADALDAERVVRIDGKALAL